MAYKVEVGNLSEKVKREIGSIGVASGEIALTAGPNTVRYTGIGEIASIALASIESYLVIAYYISDDMWEQVSADTFLLPNMVLSIDVNQDCTLSGDFSLLVGNLHGFVHDADGNPLPAVSVSLNVVYLSTATKLDGTFDFTEIPMGTYTITCTKTGYKDFSEKIPLAEGDNEIDIKMLAEGEVEIPWLWIGLGVGAAAAIGVTVVLVKKSK